LFAKGADDKSGLEFPLALRTPAAQMEAVFKIAVNRSNVQAVHDLDAHLSAALYESLIQTTPAQPQAGPWQRGGPGFTLVRADQQGVNRWRGM
jgi:hypothetical protein